MEVRNNSCWSCCPNNDDDSVLLLLPGLLVRLLLPLCVVLRRLYYSPRTHFNIIIRHLTLIASLRWKRKTGARTKQLLMCSSRVDIYISIRTSTDRPVLSGWRLDFGWRASGREKAKKSIIRWTDGRTVNVEMEKREPPIWIVRVV